MNPPRRRNLSFWALLFSLALGIWLRQVGWNRGAGDLVPPDLAGRGTPPVFYHFHPDEETLIGAALELEDPRRPPLTTYGMLPLYLGRATLELAALFSPEDLLSFATQTQRHHAFLTVRLVAVLLSCLSLWCSWKIGRQIWEERTALIGTFLIAVAPLAVQQAHFFTVDGLFALLVLVFFLSLLRALHRGDFLSYILTGALVGATMAVRLNGLSLGLALVIGRLMHPLDQSWKERGKSLLDPRLWVAGLAALLLLLILQPFLVTDPGRIWQADSTDDFGYSLKIARGETLHPWTLIYIHTIPYLYYWTDLWPTGVGWPLTLLFLGGIGLAAWRRRPLEIAILGWCLFYFFTIGGLHTKHVRYLLPLLPFFCLFAAALCSAAWQRHRLTGAGLTAALTLYTGIYGLAFSRIYRTEDSRIQAGRWIARHLPAGTHIGVERGGFSMHSLISDERYSKAPLDVGALFGARGYLSCQPTIEYLRERTANADYLALIDVNRYRQFIAVPERFPAIAEFYRRLWAEKLGFTLVERFKVYPGLGGLTFDDDDAEPSFLGFDHPAVLIFARQQADTAESAWNGWLEETIADDCCADSLMQEAGRHWAAEEWEQVVDVSRTIGQRYPRMRVGHYVAAHAYQHLGEEALMEEAIQRYTTGDNQVHAFLIPWATATTLTAAGMPELALTMLRQGSHLADRFQPEMRQRMITSYLQIGHNWYRSGRRREAFEIFELATKLDPAHFDFARLGIYLYDLGELEASNIVYEHILSIDPENAAAHINLGWNHYLQGDFDAAIEQYLIALKLGRQSTALFNLGLAYLARGDADLAEETYARAVEEFGAEEGIRIGAVDELRERVESGSAAATGRRILKRHWPNH